MNHRCGDSCSCSFCAWANFVDDGMGPCDDARDVTPPDGIARPRAGWRTMAKIDRIFLDLDGVLADWLSSAIRAHGRDPAEILASWPAGEYDLASVLGISANAMWAPIHAQGADFWADLEPYPWVHDVLAGCQSLAPTTILTSPSLDPSAAAGKVAWLQRMFGRDFRDFIIGPDKPACARPGAVLIDDRDKGCEDFIAAGGSAVVFPQPWNRERAVAIARGPRTMSVEGPWGYLLHRLVGLGARS